MAMRPRRNLRIRMCLSVCVARAGSRLAHRVCRLVSCCVDARPALVPLPAIRQEIRDKARRRGGGRHPPMYWFAYLSRGPRPGSPIPWPCPEQTLRSLMGDLHCVRSQAHKSAFGTRQQRHEAPMGLRAGVRHLWWSHRLACLLHLLRRPQGTVGHRARAPCLLAGGDSCRAWRGGEVPGRRADRRGGVAQLP